MKINKVKDISKNAKKSKVKVDVKIDNYEYKLKSKGNNFLALILRKNKSAMLCYIPMKCKSFSIEGNTYFSVQSGVYVIPKNTLLCVYLEGCVLPIEHSYIKYEKQLILLTNKFGKPITDIDETVDKNLLNDLPKDNNGNYLKDKKGHIVKKVLQKIKGLEFDSTIADSIYSSGLIEKVAHPGKLDVLYFVTFLFTLFTLIGVCIVGIISYFRV